MLSVLIDEKACDWSTVHRALLPTTTAHQRYSVSGGAPLHQALLRLVAAKTQGGGYVLNACCGDDAANGVSAHMAALLLEQCRVPYSGCRASLLGRPLDVLYMMMWYAGMPLPAFATVASRRDAAAAAAQLKRPLRLRAALPFTDTSTHSVTTEEPAVDALLEAYSRYGTLVVWEDDVRSDESIGSCPKNSIAHVLVSGGLTRGALAVAWVGATGSEPVEAEAQLREWAASFSRDVLSQVGLAQLTFTLRAAPDSAEETLRTRWRLAEVVLNPPLDQLALLFQGRLDHVKLLDDMRADALSSLPAANYEIRLNVDSRKGYSLCAARAIKKGEIVFEDEGRSFAIITRPFVEQTWDAESKKTFTEYAWPLDTEGHVYAIWEKEPTRWRPINHSCDPTCIFAAPHSLNVIAARDLAEGEDLSMDYATFCDRTMRPFRCLCGSACCRGLIAPDEEALRKYGENAWLRRVPPPVKPLL